MTASLRAMPNRTCALGNLPMESSPVASDSPLRCPTCGYDLHAVDLNAPCPECGTPGADALKPSLVNHATRASLAANLLGAFILALPAGLAIVINLVRAIWGKRLVRMNPDLYDTFQIMVLVVGIFFITDAGHDRRLRALRMSGWLVRGAASLLGVATAFIIYSARELFIYSGMWTSPITSAWQFAQRCELPAVIALGLALLWRHLLLWAGAARDQRVRPLIGVTLGVALFFPLQNIVHNLMLVAAVHLGSGLATAARWTALPLFVQPFLYLLSILLWLALIARFVYTTRAVIHRRTST